MSLSGITLWTTCSSGAVSSAVFINMAAGLVTLLGEKCVPLLAIVSLVASSSLQTGLGAEPEPPPLCLIGAN